MNEATNFDVEITYSRDKYWSHWNSYDALETARYEVQKLKASSPEGFNARIVRKEIIQ